MYDFAYSPSETYCRFAALLTIYMRFTYSFSHFFIQRLSFLHVIVAKVVQIQSNSIDFIPFET